MGNEIIKATVFTVVGSVVGLFVIGFGVAFIGFLSTL